jgi:hypothetical protein
VSVQHQHGFLLGFAEHLQNRFKSLFHAQQSADCAGRECCCGVLEALLAGRLKRCSWRGRFSATLKREWESSSRSRSYFRLERDWGQLSTLP